MLENVRIQALLLNIQPFNPSNEYAEPIQAAGAGLPRQTQAG